MFVQTEVTPNPNSLKFLPGKTVSNNGSFEITKKDNVQNELVKNLLNIYSCLTNTKLEKSIKNFSKKNFSDFKEILSQVLVEKIVPISQEIKKLLNDQNYLDKILLDGSEKANKIASEKVKKIHEIIGF